MSRGLERDDDQRHAAHQAHLSRGGHSTAGARPRDTRRPEYVPLPTGHRRETVVHEGRAYRLRGSESRTLDTLGTFRVVLARDVGARLYQGDARGFDRDLRSLQAQKLVERRAIAADRRGHSEALLTLSETGRTLLETHRGPSAYSPEEGRPVYAGWGKPKELVHNASLYRMFELEAERLAEAGGRIHRVVLDDELKRDLYADLNVESYPTASARQARLIELAEAHELPVVDGHVQLPDVRIEYETASGERARVDLELATNHYHGGHLGAKQRAGFSVYSAAGHAGRGIRSLGTSGRGGASFDPHHLSGLLSL